MGTELTSAYATATDKSYWPLVLAHLKTASPFMLATHDRNLDIDCRDIPVLRHAAITTDSVERPDSVESQFATYDYALRIGASFGAMAGVAQSIRMHAMDTPGAKQQQAAAAVIRKRKKSGGNVATEAEQVAEQLAKWDKMSFFALAPERR